MLPIRSSQFLLVAVIAFLAASPRLSAQSSSSADSDQALESKTAPDFSNEPAVFDYVETLIRCENDGTQTTENRVRMRIQTQAGLSAYGQLIFNYNASYEQIELKSIRVIKTDGSSIVVGPDSVQDLSSPVTRIAPIYTDERQKHVTLPGIAVGDTVQYDVVTHSKPLAEGQFWSIRHFARKQVALNELLELDVPASRPLKTKAVDGASPPRIRDEGDRRIYRWTASNLSTPSVDDPLKSFEFDISKLLGNVHPPLEPIVMFSTFQNWNEIADWYAGLERDRRVPTPEVRAKADEIVKGMQSDEEKARALYDWVSRNVRYVSLSLGPGRYQPHAAGEVLTNLYGDCKDKATLLEAMLEAEGMHADPVIANPYFDPDPDVPNPMQFDHMFTHLRIGQTDWWLDTTLGAGPFGYLLPQLRGKRVFVLSHSAASGLTRTPEDLPLKVEYQIGIDGKITSDGDLDANIKLQTRGDLEVLIRSLNDHLSQEQMAKAAGSVLKRTNKFLYGSPSFTDFQVENGSDLEHPLKVHFHASGKAMYVSPKDATPKELVSELTSNPLEQKKLLSLLPAKDAKTGSNEPGAVLPIELKGPKSYSVNLSLSFPDLVVSELPAPKELAIDENFAKYESRDSWDGSTFHGFMSLDLLTTTVSPGDSNEYASFLEKIRKDTEFPFRSSAGKSEHEAPAHEHADTGSSKAAHPASAEHEVPKQARDSFVRGEDETKRKNWANAIEAFAAAVKENPEFAGAWRELGRAQMNARHYSDAEASFQKFLQLSPEDSTAYLNLAWALYNERKFKEEVDFLVRRIDHAPNDGDANYRLGTAYLALHQPDKAVPVLEKATEIFPHYEAAQVALGRAYLLTGQGSRAVESLRSALAINGSESTLNSIAYLLSEHGAFLETATEWSQRAIDVVEKELNDTSLSNTQSQTWALVLKLGQYWDTMGWIKFQQGDLESAGKYISAAWQVSDDLAIGEHLGRIYESQGHKPEAIEMYLAALNTTRAGEPLNDDALDTRKRLTALLGGDDKVDEQLAQFRKTRASSRSVNVDNNAGAQGVAQYVLMINANSRVVDFVVSGPDDTLSAASDALRQAKIPQTFPDASLKQMPRLGTLACVSTGQPCVLTLASANSAARSVPSE